MADSPWWAGWIGMRGAASETTTRETTKTSVETKIRIQVYAWAVIAFVGFPTTGIGAWLGMDGLNRVMDWNLAGKDILFGFVLLGIVSTLVVQGVKDLLGESSPAVRSLVSLLLGAGAIGAAIFLYGEVDKDDFWPAVEFLFGVGMLYAGPLLIYYMSMQLRDPFGFLSPFEQRFLDIYEMEANRDHDDEEYVDPPIPATRGNQIAPLAKDVHPNGKKQRMNPDVYLLAEFLRRADNHGFTRSSWLAEGRKDFNDVKLRVPGHPDGPRVRISRGVYERMISMASTYGWITDRGSGWEWSDGVNLDVALDELQQEINYLKEQGVQV